MLPLGCQYHQCVSVSGVSGVRCSDSSDITGGAPCAATPQAVFSNT
jgi:hypothetical protein